jgi:uncharacterized membrane protein YfcA
MEPISILIFAIVGAAAQFVDGLLGMGFGVVSASMLTVIGFSAVTASAGVHAAKVGTTFISGASHWHAGNVDWRVLITVGVPGAVGAFLGAVVLVNVSLAGARMWMAIVLAILGVLIIMRYGFGKSLIPAMKVRSRNLWPIGLIGGFVDATGGGGWGPVATPSLMTVTRHKPHRIVGTVSAAEFLVAVSASLGFIFGAAYADIPWFAVLGLFLGGAITAPIAARLAHRAPTKPLGVAVGAMVIVANIVVIVSVLGLPGLVGLAAVVAVIVPVVVLEMRILRDMKKARIKTPVS